MADSADSRKYLTEDELRRFLGVIKSVRDRAIFTVAYWRGLRASEIGLMPWNAWDQKARRIYVWRLKRSLAGEFPLSPAETKALTAWRQIRGNQPGPMFTSRKSGSYTRQPHGKSSAGIGRGQIHALFAGYAAKAGLPEHLRHEHCLKHAVATHLLAKGADIIVVKDWIGHAQIANTQIYAQIRNRQRDADAQKVYLQG